MQQIHKSKVDLRQERNHCRFVKRVRLFFKFMVDNPYLIQENSKAVKEESKLNLDNNSVDSNNDYTNKVEF